MMTDISDVALAQKRINTRLVANELVEIERERALEEQRRNLAAHAIQQGQAEIEADVKNRLLDLQPLYEERAVLFEAFSRDLGNLTLLNGEIERALDLQSARLQGHPTQKRERFAELCRAALLPIHWRYSGGSRLARTVATALTEKIIQPGQILAGGGVLHVDA